MSTENIWKPWSSFLFPISLQIEMVSGVGNSLTSPVKTAGETWQLAIAGTGATWLWALCQTMFRRPIKCMYDIYICICILYT